jgi:glutathione synthase/RimK-type ligase-like ATP-grasp enzyme
MILVITEKTDLHAYAVMFELDRLGVECRMFDAASFPLDARVSQHIGCGGNASTVELEDGTISSSDVTAVWYRKPAPPQMDPALSSVERRFSREETKAVIDGLYDSLAGAYWISSPKALQIASLKPRQLRAAMVIGMDVPRTIITNDETEARNFIETVGKSVVYKTACAGVMYTESPAPGFVIGEIYTSLLTDDLITRGMRRLRSCPVLLQEYVDKDIELRVTVVGDHVFAAEIHSQDAVESRVDWRQGDVFDIEHRPHDLPNVVEDQCRQLVRGFGLEFGAIDIIKSPDGRYVFLELNPNGQYAWIEKMARLPISRQIAKNLAAADRLEHSRLPFTTANTHEPSCR